QGFFRRTIRLKLEYETCMEACTVSIKSRNKCQFCRFKKCIGLGMSRDAIRFGRMPRHEKQQIIREIDESFAQATGSDKCQIKMQNLITEVSESFLRHISLTAERVNKCWESRKTLGDKAKTLHTFQDIPACFPNLSEYFSQFKTLVTQEDGSFSAPWITLTEHLVKMYPDSGNTDTNSHKTAPATQKVFPSTPSHSQSTPSSVNKSNSSSNTAATPSISKPPAALSELPLEEELAQNHTDVPPPPPPKPPVVSGAAPFLNPDRLDSIKTFHGMYKNICSISDKVHKAQLESDPDFLEGMDPKKLVSAVDEALTPDHKARLLFASQILKKRTQKGSGPSSKPLLFGRNALGSKIVQILYCDFQARVVKGICELTEFAKSLPNFLRISLHDQVILLKYGSYETMFVLFSRLIIEDGMLLPKSNIYVTFNFVYQLGVVGEIMRSKFEFAKRMLSLGLTDVEMALFVGVILLCPDRPGIDNRKVVEDIQEEILLALEYQLSLTHPNKPRLFAHLLLKLAELRELMSKHVSMVQKLSEMKGIGPPLLNEILQDLT
uniref:Uncharacterized protein n=1 Tax=Ciona savignyi TaxID=51511 RepID=H2YJM3_CIOSA